MKRLWTGGTRQTAKSKEREKRQRKYFESRSVVNTDAQSLPVVPVLSRDMINLMYGQQEIETYLPNANTQPTFNIEFRTVETTQPNFPVVLIDERHDRTMQYYSSCQGNKEE